MPSILNATTTNGLVTSADNSGSLQLQTNNGTTAVTIDTSQNVGVGTTSPAYKIDVNGTIRGRGDAYLGWVNGSQAGVWWSQSNYAVPAFQGLTSAGNVGNICMQLGGGSLLVSTTTSSIGNLVVRDTTQNFGTGLSVQRSDSNNRWEFVYGGDNNFYLGYNGAQRGVFNNSTGAYSATSDISLKKNITPISYGLKEISALLPSEYLMKDDEESESSHLGFIAQDVKSVIPNAVKEMKDGILGLEMTAFIPVLVKAIQEQQAQIEELKAKVSALEGAK